ncbi:MAG: hypothetical protein WAK26_12975, partial [Terracidiphilus sp.]
MTHRAMNRRRLFVNAALVALALLVLAMPATQNVLACALDEFAEITERTLHFPCTLLDHYK